MHRCTGEIGALKGGKSITAGPFSKNRIQENRGALKKYEKGRKERDGIEFWVGVNGRGLRVLC